MVVAEELPECVNAQTVVMNHLKHVVSPVEIKNAQNAIHHYVEQIRIFLFFHVLSLVANLMNNLILIIDFKIQPFN
ncbi:MAG: hypothetical protein HY802_00630 [Methanobacterium sp.]|nr:hypothetical protein [Methanobacterium sp.]